MASAAILVAGWQAGAHVAESNASATTTSAVNGAAAGTGSSGSGSTGTGSSGTGSSSSGAAGTGATGSGGAAAGASAKAGGSYTGTAVQTRFGTVQVQVTVKGGVITEVTALQLTDAEQRSVQISNRAAPVLRSEVLEAQSADVQTVSGATVTSDAYLTSLQAALDAANF
jgi:uncharacterized protein with FMN-binding domain